VARRKRRSSGNNLGGLLLVLLAAAIALSVLSALAQNPPLLAGVLACGGAGLAWRVSVRRRRARELAEAQREADEIYAARVRAIETYHAMTARQFEEALAYLCRRDGCPEAYVTGRAGDLGADVLAVTPDGRRMVIQAKRYVVGNMVTGPALQQFGGTCYAVHRADIAAVVTTSGFTRQARDYANAMRIALFDTEALAGWAAGNGPSPWQSVPAPLRPITAPGLEPRGRHSRPS
jgi:restriction system protein